VAQVTQHARPKHVVIVDADNPMEEIHGEFFWREDHERILAAERELEYQRGFRDGASVAARAPRRPARRIRRELRFGLMTRAVLVLVVISYAVVLIRSFSR